MKKVIVSLLCAASICCLSNVSHAAPMDSTQAPFIGTEITSAAMIPIGTIVVWSVSKNPDDHEAWLECNGQSISRTKYPELYSLVGSKTPDFRGLFLRGHGSRTHSVGGFPSVTHSSGALGQIQGHAILDHTHSTSRGNWTGDRRPYYQGAGELQGSIDTYGVSGAPTAEENRPINTAVRYLIRAL